MKKLIIYKDGGFTVSDGGASISLVGKEIEKEIDITKATDAEVTVLLANPNNTQLIEEILNRVYTE